jgi:hypothetical protein
MKTKLPFILAAFLGSLAIQVNAQRTALHFDGVDDYVPITGTTALNSMTRITLETWIYVDNFSSSPCGDCAPIIWNQGKAYRFGTGNGKQVNVQLSDGSASYSLTSATTLQDSTWHHIACTFDGSKIRIYIDGACTDSSSQTFNIGSTSSTADVWIVDPVTGYGGILEETRIWNFARTARQVKEGMIQTYPSSATGLVLQLHYEDGIAYDDNTSLSTITDDSPNAHTATLSNFDLTGYKSNFALGRSYCDTAVYATLKVKSCLRYTLPSGKRIITKSGTYGDTIVSYRGCDSIMTIDVTINLNSSASQNIIACDSFRNPMNSAIYRKSGKYQATIKNWAGCDSVVSFNVTILKKDTTTFDYNACGSVKLRNGNTVTANGVYIDRLKGYRSCDSIVIHRVQLRQPSTASRQLTFCKFVICPTNSAKVFRSAGLFYDTIPNYAGCDSVIAYTVKSSSTSGTVSANGCSSFKSPSGRYTWTQSGTYKDTLFLSNYRACDSFVTVNLTLKPVQKINRNETHCRSYTVPSGTRTLNSSQVVKDIIKGSGGCDSIEYTINVTINNANTAFVINGNVLTASTSTTGAALRWLDCQAAYTFIPGATARTFEPGKDGNFALEVKESGCTDTSVCKPFAQMGLPWLQHAQLQLLGNPSKGQFTLRAIPALGETTVQLYNVEGKLLRTWQLETLSELPLEFAARPGLHYLRVVSRDAGQTLPIVFE